MTVISLAGLVSVLPSTLSNAGHVTSTSVSEGPRLAMPIMNPERGKELFVSKGCIAFHAINGVDGHDAPPLDAHTMQPFMDPFDFVAKMWNHAPGMIAAQEMALGKQIEFTGREIADIIGFVHDHEIQHPAYLHRGRPHPRGARDDRTRASRASSLRCPRPRSSAIIMRRTERPSAGPAGRLRLPTRRRGRRLARWLNASGATGANRP